MLFYLGFGNEERRESCVSSLSNRWELGLLVCREAVISALLLVNLVEVDRSSIEDLSKRLSVGGSVQRNRSSAVEAWCGHCIVSTKGLALCRS